MGQKRDKDGRAGRVHLNAYSARTTYNTYVSTNNNNRIEKKGKEINEKNLVLGTTLSKEKWRGETGSCGEKVYLIKRYRDKTKV